MKKAITYSSTGVNYSAMDPLKKLAQKMGKQTSENLSKFNAKEIAESRGESAYVWEEENSYRAFVIEGLGTKNLVADEMNKITGQTYYDQIAQDTVAAIVNDIITVGAEPQVINAYFGSGGPEWFSDSARSNTLVEGWAKACNLAGCTWGGGETPTLKGIINPDTLDLVGACVGIIKPKSKLKIGLISTPFFTVPPKFYGGLEQVVWDLACGLSKLGHEVTLFAPKGSQAPPGGL